MAGNEADGLSFLYAVIIEHRDICSWVAVVYARRRVFAASLIAHRDIFASTTSFLTARGLNSPGDGPSTPPKNGYFCTNEVGHLLSQIGVR
jgi:hypothetical protein